MFRTDCACALSSSSTYCKSTFTVYVIQSLRKKVKNRCHRSPQSTANNVTKTQSKKQREADRMLQFIYGLSLFIKMLFAQF